MASAHTELHDVPVARIRRALLDAGIQLDALTLPGHLRVLETQLGHSDLTGLRPAFDWIQERVPAVSNAQVVCHQDFHLSNILLHDGRVSGVIDWAKIALGDREWDVALTSILLDLSDVEVPGYRWAAKRAYLRWVSRRYLAAYARRAVVDRRKLIFYEALHCFGTLVRASILRTPGLDPNVQPVHVHDWDAPAVARAVAVRLEKIAGFEVPLPPGV